MSPDQFNALFEAGGACAVWLSIRQALRSRSIRGLSGWQLLFFQSWGLWNVFYYPSIGQSWSFYAGCALALSNTVYLTCFWRYRNA